MIPLPQETDKQFANILNKVSKMANKQRIDELKKFNPIVYRAMSLEQRGYSYEEALEVAVVSLARKSAQTD